MSDLSTITDPVTGMTFLRMESWAAIGLVATPAAIAAAEALEGQSYETATGAARPDFTPAVDLPSLANQVADALAAIDQLILDSLGGF